MTYAVVIPTTGPPSLQAVLDVVGGLQDIVVVDDRPGAGEPLALGPAVRVLSTGGRGPAAARNAGWRAVRSEWVAFLDDDVVPGPDWAQRIADDLRDLPPDVGASQGRIEVPLPTDRRPTDLERGTAGLATARWITADMAYAQYKPPPDAKLNRPEDVAATVVYALRQPPGCQLRELVVCSSEESSWP